MTRNPDYRVNAAEGPHDISRLTSLSDGKDRRKKKESEQKKRRGNAKDAGTDDQAVAKAEEEPKTKAGEDHMVDYYA